MNTHQRIAIQALSNMLGDDLQRAQNGFRNYTSAQMDSQHVHSGKTPRQILEEYKAHDAKVKAAIEWVKAQS